MPMPTSVYDLTGGPTISLEATPLSLSQTFRLADQAIWNRIVAIIGMNASPLLADMFDVGRSLFLADCKSKRPSTWHRHIEITIPVRECSTWACPSVKAALNEVLAFATGDEWEIHFVSDGHSPLPINMCLPFETNYRVCLFSEGLDSLAGLSARLSTESSTTFLAVSALTQSQTYGRIRRAVKSLNKHIRPSVISVPIPLYRRRNVGQGNQEEPSQRTRSLLLLMLGAIVALMAGQTRLEIFENGIEIFNFPLAPCLETERMSRTMHPILLVRMADLISALTGAPFTFAAPFVFQTKGDMVRELVQSGPVDLINNTLSCIHFPQRKAGPPQCGVCTGCVLRRIALYDAGFAERIDVYQADFLTGRRGSVEVNSEDVLWNTIFDIDQRLFQLGQALDDHRPDRGLMALSGLDYRMQDKLLYAAAQIAGICREKVPEALLRLYGQYAGEWERIRPIISVLPQGSLFDSRISEEVRANEARHV